jgi:ATP phosphoribosyltransferase
LGSGTPFTDDRHLASSGQDVIAESTHASQITEILPLGFGKCTLQVQVPVSGPIQSVEALSGGRVATSFEVLAGKYFGDVDKKEGKETSVEYVGGSVEAACALGMADGIGELVVWVGCVEMVIDVLSWYTLISRSRW